MKKIVATLALGIALMPASADAQTAYSYSHNVGISSLTLNGSTVIDNSTRGWCRVSGSCNGASALNNYIVGPYSGDTFRDWFRFAIPNIGPITSAVFSVNAGEIYGTNVNVNFFDLALGNAPGTPAAAYADMGTGNLYGNYVYNSSDNYTYTNVTLNGAALADLNAAAGGDWAMGGDVGAEVVATPEPASMVLLATGLLALGGTVTRRRRTSGQ